MKIQCPGCGHQGNLPEGGDVPALVRCPRCSATFQPGAGPVAPAGLRSAGVPGSGATILCRQCGTKNPENHYKCTTCGAVLHRHEMLPPASSDDGTLGGLIPVRNTHALIAYYMGVFSLIPCLGIPLGIMALGFGISGVCYANRNPQAKGKIHAWVGIILGGLCALLYIGLLMVPVFLSFRRR